MTTLFSDELKDYLNSLVPKREDIVLEMEERAAREGFPIIGPASGQACYLMARMINAKKIFELGSGFGYSTAWFAKAVQENGGGEVHHVVWDQSLSLEAKKNLDQLGYTDIVHYAVGEAVKTLEASNEIFDLIFCDVDKEGYPEAVQMAGQKLRKGGLLIIDNMLWSGDVYNLNDQSATTQGIRDATEIFTKSKQWIFSLLPIRDGIIVAMKD